MSASDALGGQFFHGTPAELSPGDTVLPGSKAGTGRGKSVWLARDADSARGWGAAKAMRSGHMKESEDGWGNGPSVPVHVYEVTPSGHTVDRNGHDRADSAVVKRRV